MNSKKIFSACISVAVLATYSIPVFSQVEVVDRRSPSTYQADANESKQVSANQLAELYHQVQVLQQEVMELRGQLDEQNHHLKQLKKQRLDDYVDLDRRIGEVNQSSGKGRSTTSKTSYASPLVKSSTTSDPVEPQAKEVSPADEIASYREAIDLVLKKKDYDKASQAFGTHLQNFPDGRYSANAKYWLGEIYLQKNDLKNAQNQFATMLDTYPNHSKALDAKFKLGKVYFLRGDKDKALTLLEEVAQTDGSTGSLAKEYIRKNFPS